MLWRAQLIDYQIFAGGGSLESAVSNVEHLHFLLSKNAESVKLE